jgi:flavorubredoxin
MKAIQVAPDIYWVGGIDWDLRNFHGYLTQRGSTYNAWLIMDDEVTLIDTVKSYMRDEMLSRISDVVDPADISVVVSNHVEMDHSGNVPYMQEIAPTARVITSKNGEAGLKAHYGEGLDLHAVDTGDTISIGKRTLQFVLAPMVHWPDSMVTYCPEDKILFSNDGFGQHVASTERFADELGLAIVMEEAAKYYANIVLPYGAQVQKLLGALGDAPVEMVLNAHGVSWRGESIGTIVDAYKRWAANETVPKAVVIYDTMWKSTQKLAYALAEGLEDEGVPFHMGNLQATHISDMMTEVLEARGILIGTPTLNSRMLPTVAAATTYMAGLRPRNRLGLAFGSCGWGKQGVTGVVAAIEGMGWEQPVDPVAIHWVPGEEDLAAARQAGAQFARAIKEQ